jgi:hypothetical protein
MPCTLTLLSAAPDFETAYDAAVSRDEEMRAADRRAMN